MGAEYEVKFAASGDLLKKVAGDFPGGRVISMESTYFDTLSGALSQKRYTLRRRLENGVCVYTLKTPGTGFGRGEWETQAQDLASAIEKLCKLDCPQELAGLTRDGVIPICGASFTRQALLIEKPAFRVELALDEGILTGGERQCPLKEIELEFKGGDMDAFFAFTEAFAAQYQLQSQPLSKFRRALNLYLGEK